MLSPVYVSSLLVFVYVLVLPVFTGVSALLGDQLSLGGGIWVWSTVTLDQLWEL